MDGKLSKLLMHEEYESWVKGKFRTDDPFGDKTNRMNETKSFHAEFASKLSMKGLPLDQMERDNHPN